MEEQFYLVWPLWLLAFWRLAPMRHRNGCLLLAIGTVVGISLLASY